MKHKKLAKYSQNIAENSLTINENFHADYLNSELNKPKGKMYECKYCDKVFKHQSSLSKHIKYSCKHNKDEDLKELARLLNETIKDKDKELLKIRKQIDKLQINYKYKI